jgi:hypothetical protein
MKYVQFETTDEDDTEGLLIYRVPDGTVISKDDAQYDAEQASLEAGTYPPAFVPLEEC